LSTDFNAEKRYLYCIIPYAGSQVEFGKIGIGGKGDPVYTIAYNDIAAVVSNTTKEDFERTDENILAHQQVVQRVFESTPGIPLPFATLMETDTEVHQLLEEHYGEYKDKLAKLGALGQPEPTTSGTRELMEELLAQSAESAVRIRQLNDEIEQLRELRYEKVMETATDNLVKKLSGAIPPGQSPTKGTQPQPRMQDAMAAIDMRRDTTRIQDTVDQIQKRMETLQGELARIGKVVDKPASPELESLSKEMRTFRDEISRLKTIQQEASSLENTIRGTLKEYFGTQAWAPRVSIDVGRQAAMESAAPTIKRGVAMKPGERPKRPKLSDVMSAVVVSGD